VVEFENMEKARETFASPSYSDVRTIGNKYAKFRIVAVESPARSSLRAGRFPGDPNIQRWVASVRRGNSAVTHNAALW
jgi:hypothetical protein